MYPVGGVAAPAVIVYVVLATLVSWLSAIGTWYLYERHFLKLKGRFFWATAGRNDSNDAPGM